MKAISGVAPAPQAPKSLVDIMQTMMSAKKAIPAKTPASHSPMPEQGKGNILSRFDSAPSPMIKIPGK